MDKNELLIEVLKDLKGFRAAKVTKRAGPWVEFVIGIDDDNVVYVTMPKESYDILNKKAMTDG